MGVGGRAALLIDLNQNLIFFSQDDIYIEKSSFQMPMHCVPPGYRSCRPAL